MAKWTGPTIIIDNLNFPVGSTSDNPDEKGRIEEDGMFGASTLEKFRGWWGLASVCILAERHNLHTKQDWTMFVLPHLAKYYNVDRNLILKEWTHFYAIHEVFSDG